MRLNIIEQNEARLILVGDGPGPRRAGQVAKQGRRRLATTSVSEETGMVAAQSLKRIRRRERQEMVSFFPAGKSSGVSTGQPAARHDTKSLLAILTVRSQTGHGTGTVP